jgi:membrane fusion protein (multidrug efflux system)
MGSTSPVLVRLLLLSTVLVACEETKAKTAPPPPPVVMVAPVSRQAVSLYTEAVGAAAGYIDAEIRARVRGFLESQRYKDGSSVKEGQTLFTIQATEYQAAAGAAKANLARAQTAVLHNKALLERRQALIKSKVVSEQELEDAEAGARDAENQVEAARAQLRQAELNLSYTQIRSPLSGVAGLALVRVGNLVGQDGPTLLTTVSQLDPIRVNFPLGEIDYVKAAASLRRLDTRDLAWARAQFARMAAGQPSDGGDPGLELVLADGKPYPHKGVVISANRQVDPATGTIQIQALFPNPDNLIRPGQYARVRMRRAEVGEPPLVVPEAALLAMQGTYSVAVVGSDNKASVRRVEVGASAGQLRIITAGLQEGERVVVTGVQKATDGALVNPQPAQAASAPTPPPAGR